MFIAAGFAISLWICCSNNGGKAGLRGGFGISGFVGVETALGE